MAADVKIDIAAEFTGKKAFRQAETATDKLVNTTKKLAGALGLAFGTQAIVNFGKLAVRASLDQQAEQNRLNQLLKVGVGATTQEIALLNEQAAALEKIGVVTGGNITQTQSQLATFNLQVSTIQALTPAILDYVTAEKGATASTADFKSMTNGLAQALNGNFASLTRVGFVLDENTKKQIKSGTETERAEALVKVLNSTYKDFNKNLRETDAGKMQVLSNAAQDATTIIGTGLLDALKGLGEDNSVDELATNMQNAALYTADVIRGIGTLTERLKSLPVLSGLNVGMIPILGTYLELLRGLGKVKSGAGGFPQGAPAEYQTGINARAERARAAEEAKARKAAATASAKLAAVTKQNVKVSKDQLKIAKAKAIFDIQKIQIEAALKGKISEEERIRLLLLRAIAEENIDDIEKYTKMLNAVQGKVVELQDTLADVYAMDAGNPFISWEIGLDGVQRALIEINEQSIELTSTLAQNSLAMGLLGGASFAQALSGARYAAQAEASMGITGTIGSLPPAGGAGGGGAGGDTNVTVVVQGTLTTEAELKQSIIDAMNSSALSGNLAVIGPIDRLVAI
jgi:hypothetical protein